MSRIGKQPVKIAEGVQISIADGVLTAKGKLGEERVVLSDLVNVEVKDGFVEVSPKDAENANARVMWGTIRAHVNNAVTGVSAGFEKSLELKGVGFKAALKGNKLDLIIGFSHNVEYELPKGLKAEIVSPTEIKLTSSNKELLGKSASEIRMFRKPEPYKGKGIRYKGEFVRRKEGKKK